ncbi:MAG: acyl CoA:acetate/3-ketoacid CoA transferase, partial [Chloroflexi bacterium]|nr:acyl CoA:acetate/3-ketoacid CoA transferase [Chloroflexota bacterium]
EPLSHEGFLKRVVGGYYKPHPALGDLINRNKVEAYMYPLGTLGFWCQQMAAGRSGYLTQVGLETYLDPRQGGGKLNAITTEDLVSLVTLQGQEYLWYKELPITAALIRATTADEDGNLSLEEETLTMSILYQALAAKRSGGVVIAQVKKLVPAGSIHPRMVVVPGFLVDCLVVDPDQHVNEATPDRDWLRQTERVPRPPAPVLVSPDAEVWKQWLLEARLSPQALDNPYPLSADKLIARRAALEFKRGEVVNVGAGPPLRNINPVAMEEDIDEDIELTSETGVVGGINNGSGLNINVRYYFDTPGIFSFYNAGLITTTYLGMLDFDRQGNVNNMKYGDTWVGPGGSIDIAHNVRKIVFVGTFSAGGLKTEASDGRLAIVQEGSSPRAVDRVQWVCFNGPKMFREGKEVLYITERAVFKLSAQGPLLTEVAPGVDIERDVIGRMGFRPAIARDLRPMDGRIFRRGLMGLGRLMNLS